MNDSRHSILLVDDHPMMRRGMRQLLELEDDFVIVGEASDGEEALRLGFATRVCADPRAEALALAHEIAGKSPSAIRGAKRLI